MQSFMLGAYWDARRDTLDTCVEKAARFFAGMAEIDPLLAQWYEKGRSRKDALTKKVDILDRKRLEELLLKGRNRTDVGREIIDDLGFSIRLWNGASQEEAEATVGIHCGCYSERVGNNVIIDLPCQSESSPWVSKASSLLALVAETWRPKWAGIMSERAMRERDFSSHPFVDWMVYVPRPIAAVPSPGRIETLDGLGSIIVVQPDPPLGADSEEASRIRQVERLLAA
ncbi:immunity 52 family protein [Sphingomonas canadensis]|uniref:Immunity 52 family protein n=1 Tax=Sphingomonas canadensis TaxID=1219257 RepID=A0ABW3HAX5_9SPHN|nr:immunity 52 family protein [Sphingomonas canadensis]MCW3838460.1 immunity 52 family protein [Sphingomonas canadensis]